MQKLLAPFLALAFTWILSLGALAATPAPAYQAPQPRFDRVGADVIPRDVVPALAQDKSGFLWIATGDGLVRFDGYHFRAQEKESANPSERSLGWIRALLGGQDGRLWIGTENQGLASFDPQTDRVTLYGGAKELAAQGTAPALPTIRALAEDRQGQIYIGSVGGGLEVFDTRTSTFKRERHSSAAGSLPDDRIYALLVDQQDTLWVGSWAGLSRRLKGSAQFETIPLDLDPTRSQMVRAIYQTTDGRIWVGTQEGQLTVLESGNAHPPALAFTAVATKPGAITSFVETSDGRIWAGRSTGIQIHDGQTGAVLQRLEHDVQRPRGLAGNDVTTLMRDKAGWIWVGGFGLGLQRHNPGNKSIWLREPDRAESSPLRSADIRSLLQLDNGEIWAANHMGTVAILDQNLGVTGQLRVDDLAATPPVAAPIPRIQAMLQTRDTNVWLGGDSALYRFNASHQPLGVIRQGIGQIRRLFESRDGAVWVGTQDGVYRLPPGGKTLARVDQTTGPVKGEIHGFAQGPDERLWMGTSDGLFQMPHGYTAMRRVQEVQGAGLGSPVVIGLLFDKQQTLWVDTGVAGLHRMVRWDGTTASYERISERHGMVGKPFGANLLEDGSGRIWSQMAVYDPGRDHLNPLTAADGADLGTGWFHSYTRTRDGRFLFGGSKGVLVVNPELFQPSTFSPPLQISELRVNGARRNFIPGPDGVVMTPSDRSFSVTFAALDFADPDRLQYAYQLQGFDPQWISTGASQRIASYSNLSPGHYVLRVRATNHSGIWSTHEISMPVQVMPAWWQTWWARTLLAAVVVAAVSGLIYLRTYRINLNRKNLENEVSNRTRDLEDLTLELQLQAQALEDMSIRDPLTGLHNRRFLTQAIESDVALAVRAANTRLQHGGKATGHDDLVFFLFDIDHFKKVNDTHGHSIGDEVLRQMSTRLEQVFRDTDYIVRWGGEEFLGVARQTSRHKAAQLAERARSVMADEPFVTGTGLILNITCSIGFASMPLVAGNPGLLDWNDMIRLADSALYAAKRAGRNAWAGALACDEEPQEIIQQRLSQPWEEWLASGHLHSVSSPMGGDQSARKVPV